VSSVQRRLLVIAASFFAAMGGCTTSDDIRVLPDAGTSQGAAGDRAPGTAGSAGGRQGSGAAGSSPTGSSGAGGVTSVGGTAGSGEGAGSGSGMAGTTAGTAGAPGGTAGTTGAAGSTSSGAAGRDGGAADTGGTPAVTYSNYIESLLIFRCGGCHFGTNMQGGFTVSYANVMAHVSSANSGCPNLDASKARIVPGKPDASLIYIKTNFASPPGGCGGHMPYQGSSLLADQQASLRDWILAGAKE
jgi:hypothetical protein